MDGFQKIDLNSDASMPSKINSPAKTDMVKKRSSSGKTTRKVLLGVVGVLIVLGIFVILGIILPGIKLASQAKVTYAAAKKVADAAKLQNVEAASTELTNTKAEMVKLQRDVASMGYLAFVPIANWYYSDAVHLVNAGLAGLDGGRVLVDSVAPYADVLGLKGKGSFTGGSAEQRIQTAVTTFSKIAPNIDKLSGSLAIMQKELDQVNPNHYPSIFGGGKIKTTLGQAKTIVDDANIFVSEATPLIKVLPEMLGEPTEKKYLVLFQNDKELRPTGGFITAYAIMRFDHGVVHPDGASDIYTLDDTVPNKPLAPRILAKYLPEVPRWNLRDTNLSPDFVTSMQQFDKLYQTAGGYSKVDGIISLDTYPLVNAIDILGGSIDVDGQTFTTKNDPRCNCANVIYELEAASDKPVNYVRTQRKGIIGDLMLAIMSKALSSSPKVYWGPLFQAMLNNIEQKHVMFYVYNTDAQSGIEALNAAGRIKSFDGDYLHINDANFGGAKSNLFITESVDQNYQIQSDGSITKTLTINYKNPYAPSDCNLERGGLCLNAVQRDLVRVYVPQGSQLMSSDGSEVKMMTYDELGKTVFEGFITVRPQGAKTYTLTYKLPFKLAGGSVLPAMYQKQPGTNNMQYTVSVNGRKVQNFPLLTDQTIKITP
ncbi:MAG TPA: DUF4012 domain-containing protein [Patescibacteria group bacterium]